MKLPQEIGALPEREIVFSDEKGVRAFFEGTPTAAICADRFSLAAMPSLAPQRSRTCLAGLQGEPLLFFCNGEDICIVTLRDGAYFAAVWRRGQGDIVYLPLPAPRVGAFAYAHAWRGTRLYLPAFARALNVESCRMWATDMYIDNAYIPLEYDDELYQSHRQILIIDDYDMDNFVVGEYLTVRYRYMTDKEGELPCRQSLLIDAVDAETRQITLYGPKATDVGCDPYHDIEVCYDLPTLSGIFCGQDRVYGFAGNKIYLSANGGVMKFGENNVLPDGDGATCFEMDTELTGGHMYRGKATFFTDGSIITLDEDPEHGISFSSVEVAGVTPLAVVSPAVIGRLTCYFSRYGLTVFNGVAARVVRTDLGVPAVAVSDGKFYHFVVRRKGEEAMLYSYDPLNDTLYRAVAGGRHGGVAALGAVLILPDQDSMGRDLLSVFADRESLPYPLSDMVECGALHVVEEEKKTATLDFGEVLMGGDFAPHALTLDCVLGEGAELALEVAYDGEEPVTVAEYRGAISRRAHYIPLARRRCERFALRLRASGDFRVFAVRGKVREKDEK